MNAIEFKNVSKKFKKGESFDSLRDFIPNLVKGIFGRNGKDQELHGKEFWALKDVSFELKKGECMGIIGPNGSGKSTTLKLLSKILKPTKGEIRINGKLSALIEVGAGFHGDLTGRENIYLNGAIIGMKKREIDKKFDSIVAFSELEEFIDTPVKRYSSGMYVRLGFSVAAHMDPEILLIDEVLSVGDISFQGKCTQKIQEIKNSGTTIIFISHNLELVRRLCPKAIFLKNGNMTFVGKSEQAIEHYLKSINEISFAENTSLPAEIKNKNKSVVNIEEIRLIDDNGIKKNEFRTGDYIKIKVIYSAKQKIIKPTFTVAVVSNGQFFFDNNSRFDGQDIEFIQGKGEIYLIIENLLLLPACYEIRAYIADKDSLSNYDMMSVPCFVKENKRASGLYYQPHYWDIRNIE